MSRPKAGDVFRYSFLWKREQEAGETGGRKPRPVCIAVTSATTDDETLLFILPVTTQSPDEGRLAMKVPMTEARRAGLDHDKPCWVMLDEINTDIFEHSHVLEDRQPLGVFSRRFTNEIQKRMLAAAKAGAVSMVGRID